MSDGVSLGSAVLDAEVDLNHLRGDLERAKAEVAAAAAEMQRMLDRHAEVAGRHFGILGSIVGTRLEQPMARSKASLGLWAQAQEAALVKVRESIDETDLAMVGMGITAQETAKAQVAASGKVVKAYEAQAAAARAAADAEEAAAAKAAAARTLLGRIGPMGYGPLAAYQEQVRTSDPGRMFAAGRQGPAEVFAGHASEIFGVRGPSRPGSLGNPITVVIEAANRTPLGALAAAIGEDSTASGSTETTSVVKEKSSERTIVTSVPSADKAGVEQRMRVAAMELGDRRQQASIIREMIREGRPHEAQSALLAAAAGRGAGGGGGGTTVIPAGDRGGGKGSGAAALLYGASWLPGAAAFGTLGSFAGLGAEHALFTGAGILGSLAGAIGGGGLLAAGAAGQMGVGGGSDLAVMKSTITDTKQLQTQYAALQKAVAIYGKNSEQAKEAQKELNYTMMELGNTAGVKAELGLAHSAEALNKYWDKATSNARVQAVKILQQGVQLGTTYVPLVAHAAEKNLAIINMSLKPLFAWLEGPEGKGVFETLEADFKKNLPSAMNAFDQAVEFIMKTIRDAAGYTGGFTQTLDRFFTKWNEPQHYAVWRSEMTHLIEDFRLWETFVKLLGEDLVGLFSKDAHTGASIIMALNEMLLKVREWERTTEGGGAIHNLFVLHREETLALLQALVSLITPFSHLYLELAPLAVPVVTDLAKAVSFLVGELNKLGPAMGSLVGVALILAKFGLLKGVLQGVAGAMGATAAKEKTMADMTVVERVAAEAAARADLELGFAETEAGAGAGAASKGLWLPATAMGAGEAGVSEAAMLTALEGKQSAGGVLGALGMSGAGAASLKANAAKGGMYGLLGGVAANTIANAAGVHGAANTAISLAGAGGGFGLAFGPLGAAAGAAIGGGIGLAIGELTSHGKTYGERLGHSIVSGLSPSMTKGMAMALEEGISRTGDHIKATEGKLKKTERLVKEGEGGRSPGEAFLYGASFGLAFGLPSPAQIGKLRAQLAKEYSQLGREAAHAMYEAYQGVQVPSTFSFEAKARETLDRLPVQARQAGEQAMLQWAAGLESEGKLPKGAVAKVVRELEGQVTGLGPYIKGHTAGLYASLVQQQSTLQNTLKNASAQYGIAAQDFNSTGQQLVAHSTRAWHEMVQVAETAPKQYRDAILHAALEVKDKTIQYADEQRHFTVEHWRQMRQETEHEAHTMGANIPAIVGRMEGGLDERVNLGVENFHEGIERINKLLNRELGELGFPEVKAGKHGLEQKAPAKGSNPFGGPELGAHGATGGVWQIGNPGEAGRDTVPIMVGRGEIVSVFNRHQIPDVNARFADVGGLSGFFGQGWAPNYMSAGGLVTNVVDAGLADVRRAAQARLGKSRAARSSAGGAGSGGHAAGTAQMRAWAKAGLQAAGLPGTAAEVSTIVYTMTRESGGNPRSENTTDINAREGHPSRGLMELIPENFATYHVPGTSMNVFDPVANVAAAVRYMIARYGHIVGMSPYTLGGIVGFASGGPVVARQWPQKTTSVPRRAKRPPHGRKVNPFGTIPALQFDKGYNQHFKTLEGLMGSSGDLARLQEEYELMTSTQQFRLSGMPHGGEFLYTPPSGGGAQTYSAYSGPTANLAGSPYGSSSGGGPEILWANVFLHREQLGELYGKQEMILADLKAAASLSGGILGTLKAMIKKRKTEIDAIKKRIEQNLKKIAQLHKERHDMEVKLLSLHKQKSSAAVKSQIHALGLGVTGKAVAIRGLEEENDRLGGSGTEVGEGGSIGKLQGQISELKTSHETVAGYVTRAVGVSGHGGEESKVNLTLEELTRQISELGGEPGHPGPGLAAKLAEAIGGGGSGESSSELHEREKVQLEEKLKIRTEELLASNNALKVFGGPGDIGLGGPNAYAAAARASRGGLFANFQGLPFVGHFDMGGVVPGAIGAPGVAVVHGGEEVTPATGARGGDIYHHWEINTLHPSDPSTLSAIGAAATRGQRLQGTRLSKRLRPGI